MKLTRADFGSGALASGAASGDDPAMTANPQHEDTEAVRAFFNNWDIYKNFVRLNYLHHREAMEAFAGWLDLRQAVGDFLDLGCGDATFTSRILSGRPVLTYTGIDCAPIALDLAAANLTAAGISPKLICGDFYSELPMLGAHFDIIFIGLSFHHLTTPDKPAFLKSACGHIRPGGALVFFEPTRLEGEDRATFMERMSAHATAAYNGIRPDQLEAALAHIRSADFPETPSDYCRMAREAGFDDAKVIFTCQENFFTVTVCTRWERPGRFSQPCHP